MGFKVKSNVPPMERELIYLLYDLCVIWGFCIPPDNLNEISKGERYEAMDFARDVVESEGLNPYHETSSVNRIAKRFEIRFGTTYIEASTFTDRIRGIKENW